MKIHFPSIPLFHPLILLIHFLIFLCPYLLRIHFLITVHTNQLWLLILILVHLSLAVDRSILSHLESIPLFHIIPSIPLCHLLLSIFPHLFHLLLKILDVPQDKSNHPHIWKIVIVIFPILTKSTLPYALCQIICPILGFLLLINTLSWLSHLTLNHGFIIKQFHFPQWRDAMRLELEAMEAN